MGIRRTEASFHAGGDRLPFRRAWLPQASAERLGVAVHGFAEHNGRSEGFGRWFAKRGCAVHAYDPQGHGRSPGARNHIRRFAGLPPEALSRDAEGVRRYVEDPLVGTKMTTSLAVELMDSVARTARGDARLEHPVLLLHGGEDSLCAPAAASEAFHRKLCGRAASQSAVRIYPGLRHEIFNEPECQQGFEDLLGWLQERESESAVAALGEAAEA